MGRIGVDLYPEQAGPFWQVETLSKSLGGSAANVAVAAARLGRRAALVTKVGDDRLGEYARRALDGFGVDSRFVGVHPQYKTPIVIAELDPPEDPGMEFYRWPVAPDLTIATDELDQSAIEAAEILWVTGTGLSAEPSASATLQAMRWRSGSTTVLDLDWRPMLWGDPAQAASRYRDALAAATVIVGNRAEVSVALSGTDAGADSLVPDDAADRLLDAGVELAVVKLGADGVLLATVDDRARVAPLPVDVVCGLGAGDAFGGALVHGLLAGWPLNRLGEFCNAAGALVASRLACADAMPTVEEVATLIATPSSAQ
jgi:5-dehydro-2-deoxygluconokinase